MTKKHTPETPNQSTEREKILEQLEKAKNSEARVRLFADIMDDKGFEAITGLFPEIGDATTSAIAGIYLLFEASRAGLSKTDYLKIVGLETADLFVGSVPLAGDVLDFFFKANKRSLKLFEKRTAELAESARAAGVPETEIANITADAETLPKLVRKVIHWGTHKSLAGLRQEVEG